MAYPQLSCYFENEVLTASPERLVQILYELGLKSLASARECNRLKDISGRVRHVNKAFAVFTELQMGLNFDEGGEVAENYARLYDYCQRRLIEANAQQSDGILAEVQGLLQDLAESWQAVASKANQERNERMYSDAAPESLSCLDLVV